MIFLNLLHLFFLLTNSLIQPFDRVHQLDDDVCHSTKTRSRVSFRTSVQNGQVASGRLTFVRKSAGHGAYLIAVVDQYGQHVADFLLCKHCAHLVPAPAVSFQAAERLDDEPVVRACKGSRQINRKKYMVSKHCHSHRSDSQNRYRGMHRNQSSSLKIMWYALMLPFIALDLSELTVKFINFLPHLLILGHPFFLVIAKAFG